MGTFFARLGPWLRTAIASILGGLFAEAGQSVVSAATLVLIEGAVMLAWGVFIAAMTTGLSAMGLRAIFMQNPFSGIPNDTMFLLQNAFPVHFACGLISSYIIWKFTYAQAILVVNRVVRYLFGS
jgi:hypothetical protein